MKQVENQTYGTENKVHKIAWSDFGPRSDPQGEAQGCAEPNLLTPTSFSFVFNYLFLVYLTTVILCDRLCENRVSCDK